MGAKCLLMGFSQFFNLENLINIYMPRKRTRKRRRHRRRRTKRRRRRRRTRRTGGMVSGQLKRAKRRISTKKRQRQKRQATFQANRRAAAAANPVPPPFNAVAAAAAVPPNVGGGASRPLFGRDFDFYRTGGAAPGFGRRRRPTTSFGLPREEAAAAGGPLVPGHPPPGMIYIPGKKYNFSPGKKDGPSNEDLVKQMGKMSIKGKYGKRGNLSEKMGAMKL